MTLKILCWGSSYAGAFRNAKYLFIVIASMPNLAGNRSTYRVLSMGWIEQNNIFMQNWIVWNKHLTVCKQKHVLMLNWIIWNRTVSCPVGLCCRILRLHLFRGVRLPQWVFSIWYQTIWSSNAGALENAEYPFIAIAPWFFLSGITWQGSVYVLNASKLCTYAKLNCLE